MYNLKKLTDAFSPSGFEDEVRDIVLSEITPFCDSIKVDKMGNIIAFKKGRSSEKKFMADAHMDEVGLIVTGITEQGRLKFDEIGGIDDRILPGKRVIVGNKRVPGVIAVSPIHLSSRQERETVTKMHDMLIDIGANTKKEAEMLAEKGDYICFESDYEEFGQGFIKAKALDDRLGVAVLIEMLKTAVPAYDFYAVFSVQEEIGCRGASVAAEQVKPDYALIVEGTICADSSKTPRHLTVTDAGKGAVFSVMERSSLANRDFLNFAKTLAEKNNIPFQYKRTGSGGNDAGRIQIASNGCKTLAIAAPCRYLHSPGCVISKKDYKAVRSLAILICERIDEIC